MKKHVIPEKFSWEECGKQFVSKAGLHGHILVAHRKIAKKFECKICFKSYTSISNLNEHRKAAHLVYKVIDLVEGQDVVCRPHIYIKEL